VRNSWSNKAETMAVQIAKNSEELNAKAKQYQDKKAELSRTMLAWDRYWTDIGTRPAKQLPMLNADLGSNMGLDTTNSPNPLLYVFRPGDNGTSVYLGAFTTTSVQPQRTALSPSWQYRASDQLDFSPGKWRFRTLIPVGAANKISDFHDRLSAADIVLRDLQDDLAKQNDRKDEANAGLNERQAELMGNPQAKKIAGEPEFSEGYVKAIQDEQNKRNSVLNELDKRRREVKAEYDRMIALMKENKKMDEAISATKQPAGPALSNK